MKSQAALRSAPPPHRHAMKFDADAAIAAGSYLGKKGYTIPKTLLSKEEQEWLRKELHVKPVVGYQVGGAAAAAEESAFSVFRENANKMYLPRFFGVERYGMPPKSEIDDLGETIDVPFPKALRDYQQPIVDVFLNHVSTGTGGGGILEVPCARGKCLGKDTPILMYDGSIKMVQDVVVGDVLMGDDSTPRNVLTLARGWEMMYHVMSDERHECGAGYAGYMVNESHILSLKTRLNRSRNTVVDISIQNFLKLPDYYHEGRGPLFGYRVPIDFPHVYVDVDPYVIGHNSSSSYPRIPMDYKCNSRQIRLQVLAGILDAHATILESPIGCGFEMTTTMADEWSLLFLEDVVFLARSLGFAAYMTTTNDDRVEIYGVGLHDIPTRKIRLPPPPPPISPTPSSSSDAWLTYPIQVIPLGVDDYYGFEIDGNRRFVLGDFTVTHNTVMGLNIVSRLQKKTLILVHKEFLMNQWIERIQEFLPTARIGRIQGPLFDIADKDVVLGMIQTMFSRDFAANAFDSFGLTIVDEVHRIGSEQFSKTLFKVVTPYMLGISATVDRKDDLTRVLYWFIGPKIYEEKTKTDDPVCVRGITYVSNDSEFNEVECDYRGQPKYSTMISKLSNFGPRSDFCVRVLADLLQEMPHCQIMVLAHTRSLLTYLYKAILHQGFATTGYYVGGMKQRDLQATESKQIVLATYAMAAEALDIKTLSVLVMVTPKTDITQSVGRILRVKHAQPVVVDILDQHDLFQNQWRQRKRFYRKCNYRIEQTDSVKYPEGWATAFVPKAAADDDDDEPRAKCMVLWKEEEENA